MNTITKELTSINKERHTVAIAGNIMKLAFEMQEFFAYDSPAKIVNHCIRLGYKYFSEDPVKFLSLIKEQ